MTASVKLSEYFIMSLDTPVARAIVQSGGLIVTGLLDVSKLPMGVTDAESLSKWYGGRRIPSSRKHLEDLQSAVRQPLSILLEKSMALSLSDSFWIKPVDSTLKWRDVNFFTNDFTDDIGEFLVVGDGNVISFMSPSNTTDGMYPKKWVIIDGFRALVKQGDWRQSKFDDLNEIFAAEILRILTRTNKVKYSDYFSAGHMLCGCFDFIKEGQNLVPAYRYLLSAGKDPDVMTKNDCYEALSQPFGALWLHTMIVLDYIIFNCDRHYNNFGFIQDAKTGEIIAPAPIFDSGNSVWAALPFIRPSDIKNQDFSARPFAPTHNLQIKYADLKLFKDELFDLNKQIETVFHQVYEQTTVDQIHRDLMAGVVKNRVETLYKAAANL